MIRPHGQFVVQRANPQRYVHFFFLLLGLSCGTDEYSGSIYGIILLQYLFSLHCNYLFTCWPLLLIYKLPEGKKHALFVLSASTQHSS